MGINKRYWISNLIINLIWLDWHWLTLKSWGRTCLFRCWSCQCCWSSRWNLWSTEKCCKPYVIINQFNQLTLIRVLIVFWLYAIVLILQFFKIMFFEILFHRRKREYKILPSKLLAEKHWRKLREHNCKHGNCDVGKLIHNPHKGKNIVNGTKTIFNQPANWRKRWFRFNVCEIQIQMQWIFFKVLEFMCPCERLNITVFLKSLSLYILSRLQIGNDRGIEFTDQKTLENNGGEQFVIKVKVKILRATL